MKKIMYSLIIASLSFLVSNRLLGSQTYGHFISVESDIALDLKLCSIDNAEESGSEDNNRGKSFQDAIDLGSFDHDFSVSDICIGSDFAISDNGRSLYHTFYLNEPMFVEINHQDLYSENSDIELFYYYYVHYEYPERYFSVKNDLGLIDNTSAKVNVNLLPGRYYVKSTISYEHLPNLGITITGSIDNYTKSELATDKTRPYILSNRPTKDLPNSRWAETFGESIITIQYYDGLGRPEETVTQGISPAGNDMVTYMEYDKMGRPHHSWLPITKSDNGKGGYIDGASIRAYATEIYGDRSYVINDYGVSNFERIKNRYMPGKEWNDRPQTHNYKYNTSSGELSCIRLDVAGNRSGYTLYVNGVYEPNTLYVSEFIDEDLMRSLNFTDTRGQKLLTRQILVDTYLDTYYVYDDFGNLCYVLPPMASKEIISGNLSNALALYGFSYTYDNKNRCIEKCVPGALPVKYIYDKNNRIILSQDGNHRQNNEWAFSIPDKLGRTVINGVCSLLNATSGMLSDSIITAVYDESCVRNYLYNTNIPFILNSADIYSVNYYDDYSHALELVDLFGSKELAYYPNEISDGAIVEDQYWDYPAYKPFKGMITGSLMAVLDDDEKMVVSRYYYDIWRRLVQSKNSTYIGGLNQQDFRYDFAGNILVSRETNYLSEDHESDIVTKRIKYSRSGALLAENTVLNNSEPAIVSYNYDELGRLAAKTYGNEEDGPSLQPMMVLLQEGMWLRYDPSAASDDGEFIRHLYDMVEDDNLRMLRAEYIDMKDQNIRDTFMICSDSGDPAVKYYFIPAHFIDAVSTLLTSATASAYSIQNDGTGAFPGGFFPVYLTVTPEHQFGNTLTETYDYNIQGWLTSQSSELFDMQLKYYDPMEREGVTPSYTGNITEWRWQHIEDGAPVQGQQANSYGFTYDALSRLTANDHLSAASVSAANGGWSPVSDGFREYGLSYDLNGNIKTLSRSGFNTASGAPATDVLGYTYTGNRLASLDHSNASASVAAAGSKAYAYDANGNMTYDERKGLHFSYNYLNLLSEVSDGAFGGGVIRPLGFGGGFIEEPFPIDPDPILPVLHVKFMPGNVERIPNSLTEGFDYINNGLIDERYFLFAEGRNVKYYSIPQEYVARFEQVMNGCGLYHVYQSGWDYEHTWNGGGGIIDPGEPEEMDREVTFWGNLYPERIPNSLTEGFDYISDGLIDSRYFVRDGKGGAKVYRIPNTLDYISRFEQILNRCGLLHVYTPNWSFDYNPGEPSQPDPEVPIIDPTGVKAKYTWLSDGTKLAVVGADGKGYVYLGSLVYEKDGSALTLESTGFGGGRILASDTPYGTEYTPNYHITDHLGSVRVVFTDSHNVLARNDYYAFGKRHFNANQETADERANRWLYNGKEMQNFDKLGLLDYGARMYDSETARWFAVDPLAEKFYGWSPYNYCYNNPSRFVDPNGMDIWEVNEKGKVVWIEKSDEHTLYATANGERGNSITLADRSIFDQLTPNQGTKVQVDAEGNITKEGETRIAETDGNGSSDLLSIWEFMANNTEVEWMFKSVKDGDEETSRLGTRGMDNASPSLFGDNENITFSIHSHPGTTDRRNEIESMHGDQRQSHGKSYPNYVYIKNTKNIYLVKGGEIYSVQSPTDVHKLKKK